MFMNIHHLARQKKNKRIAESNGGISQYHMANTSVNYWGNRLEHMEMDNEVKDWCIGKENEIINMVRHIWVRCYGANYVLAQDSKKSPLAKRT